MISPLNNKDKTNLTSKSMNDKNWTAYSSCSTIVDIDIKIEILLN